MTYKRIQWTTIFIVLLIEFIWIKCSPVEFYYNAGKCFSLILVIVFLYIMYIFYSKLRPDPKIGMALLSTLFLIICTALLLVLSYLAYTTNLPFVDSTLAAMDGYMGFSSPEIVLMFRNYPWLYIIFSFIYNCILFQSVVVILYFSFIGEKIYLERFLMLFLISLLLTIFIGALLPAAGPYVWYNYSPSPELQSALDRLYEIRNNIVNITKEDGIITVPSFHAIAAFIYIYTFRNEKKIIFIPILILNLLMVFSCLPIGQHYLTDIVAGATVFALTLCIEQLIFWSVNNHNEYLWMTFKKRKKQNYETR